MSHFTVLVIGEDPESQLAPFDENLEMDEYLEGAVSEGDMQRFLEYYRKEKNAIGDFETVYKEFGEDWNGRQWRYEEDKSHTDWKCRKCGKPNNWRAYHCGQFFKTRKGCGALAPKRMVWNSYSRFNTDARWDWYQLGGRWMGYFKLKPGKTGTLGESGAFDNEAAAGTVDAARKGDIDFDGMRDLAGISAGKRYDEFWKIVGDRDIPDWDEIKKRHGPNNMEDARNEYHSHPVTKDMAESDIFKHYFLLDNEMTDFVSSRGDYMQQARNSSIVTYAVLKDGEWHQRGEMGWFGMSFNEMDEQEWNKEFHKLIDDLPDDTLLSVYDCHI